MPISNFRTLISYDADYKENKLIKILTGLV
jgi:hypothetical protein